MQLLMFEMFGDEEGFREATMAGTCGGCFVVDFETISEDVSHLVGSSLDG